MTVQPQKIDDLEHVQVYTCDGCGSWTDRPVKFGDLISSEGWGWGNDEDGSLYCPECV